MTLCFNFEIILTDFSCKINNLFANQKILGTQLTINQAMIGNQTPIKFDNPFFCDQSI